MRTAGRRGSGVTDSLLKAIGYALAAACSALLALLEVALVPLRAGSTLVPVSVVIAVAGNALLPPLARRMTGVASAGWVTLVVWLVVVVAGGIVPGNGGDYLLPAGGGEQYVFFGVLIGGLLSTGVTTFNFIGGAGRRLIP